MAVIQILFWIENYQLVILFLLYQPEQILGSSCLVVVTLKLNVTYTALGHLH